MPGLVAHGSLLVVVLFLQAPWLYEDGNGRALRAAKCGSRRRISCDGENEIHATGSQRSHRHHGCKPLHVPDFNKL
ncbi:hypothetical protein B0T10DRAFT_478924, partial [Thelonectria olida]